MDLGLAVPVCQLCWMGLIILCTCKIVTHLSTWGILTFQRLLIRWTMAILLQKLRAVGITGNICIWLFHFLTDRSHFVRLPEGISEDHHGLFWLQTTQPTNGGAVTVDSSYCANCVEPPRPQQWGSDLPFFGHAGHADPLDGWRLLLTKAGDVETNPGPTTLNKKVWICDICHKQIHVRKQISIRCNRIEHWVHLRCAGIRQAQYTDTGTCHLHR